MWPFARKKSAADRFLDVMPEAVARTASNWTKFHTMLPFKQEVGLREKIYKHFFPLAKQGLVNNFEELRDAPDEALMLIVAEGIIASGTHGKSEIEAVLGFKLPD